MGKAHIISKNMCAMAEDGNSDSRPRFSLPLSIL